MMPGDASTPAHELLRLVRGLQISRAMHVAASLGVADILGDRVVSSAEIAELTQSHAASIYRLLRVLAAFGVVAETEPDRFTLTSLGRPLLSESPDSIRDAVLLFAGDHFLESWGCLSQAIRTGATGFSHAFGQENQFDYYAKHPELEPIVNAGMAALARLSAESIVAALPLQGLRTIVDVGGGRGVLLSKILQAFPQLHGVLFDLPHVVRAAEPVLAAAGVSERCRIVEGDMFQSMPTGGDAYVFSRVVHDWDDDRAIALLRVCCRFLRPDARVLLIERTLPEISRASVEYQSLFLSDLNMLVRTGGRERTDKEFELLLSAAGLRLVRLLPTGGEFTIIEAVAA